jgi:hypothetical protein
VRRRSLEGLKGFLQKPFLLESFLEIVDAIPARPSGDGPA